MAKVPVAPTAYLHETLEALISPGCLLVSRGQDGRPNVMTIGWGLVGIVWSRPIFTVLVRPSRHTWRLLEENGDFTVNVLPAALAEAATLCGTRSGRDLDKFAAANLTPAPAQHVRAPLIAECVVHFECRTVHKNNVDPTHLAAFIREASYPKGDFHTLYYGALLGAQADEDACEKLKR